MRNFDQVLLERHWNFVKTLFSQNWTICVFIYLLECWVFICLDVEYIIYLAVDYLSTWMLSILSTWLLIVYLLGCWVYYLLGCWVYYLLGCWLFIYLDVDYLSTWMLSILYVQDVVPRPKILNRTILSNWVYVTWNYFAL